MHILAFGISAAEPFADLPALAKQFIRQGAMIVLSHPVKLKEDVPADVLPMLQGVEVWNNRYDGKLTPRLSNLKLWQDLSKSRQLAALCGLDFHSSTDYTDVWLEVEADRLQTDAILSAIRAGRTGISHGGKRIPVNSGGRSSLPLIFILKSGFYRILHAVAYTTYHSLRKLGIQVPHALKARAKTMF
jgi:hypothetical protein